MNVLTDPTAVSFAVHAGKTTRSAPVASGIVSWETFASIVCGQKDSDILTIPRNVSWQEVRKGQARP